jgi:hypothetical protein
MEEQTLVEQKLDPNDTIYWKSCCFIISKPMLKFVSTFVISLCVLTLCCVQIVDKEITDKSLYVSLLTLLLGVYIPQPSLK